MCNYRPISVLPVLSKVFELTVHHQLYDYLDENNLLSNVQFGFRKNRSTQHAVTLLEDHIRTHMDQGKLTGAIFLDLSKAFYTVDHGCLLSKLNNKNIWIEKELQKQDFSFPPKVKAFYRKIKENRPSKLTAQDLRSIYVF